MKISDDKIQTLKRYIEKHHKEFDIYGVCVHGVGFEYRLYAKSDLDVSYLSLVDIMDRNFTLYVDDYLGNHYTITLSSSQYKELEDIIDKYWELSGKRFEDRGLY